MRRGLSLFTRVAGTGVAAAFVALPAGASTEGPLVIRPGVGIGKLRLGMTQAEARRAMGRPQIAFARSAGFGLRSVEWQYAYSAYRVRFSGPRGRLRATLVATTLVRERTRRRVGVGTLESRLLRVYPTLRCERLRTYRFGTLVLVRDPERDCTLLAPSGRRTIFRTSPGQLATGMTPPQWQARATVLEVSVATAR